MEQRLSLGHQELSQVIGNNCIYVDKTEIIYRLIIKGSYFFLSRPRRFGKSLLANTIKEIFLGYKELFKGLWIYDKWNWEQSYPVIKLSFASIGYNEIGLQAAINKELDKIAGSNKINLQETENSLKFRELIEKLAVDNKKVAIIIDEYDKPIIDYLHEAFESQQNEKTQAEINRDLLKNFYSVLKDLDPKIKFLFITGVSKFSKVSIFSDLNNLIDITIDRDFSTIVGWTKDEIEHYFPGYLKILQNEYDDYYPDIMPAITKWYNGYSWDGKVKVYNPVSIMNLFQKRMFRNYWFETATPTFLIEIIRKQKLNAFDIEKNTETTSEVIDKYDFKTISLTSLLFQTGYLTIKNLDKNTGRIKLGYPNKEVEESFSKHILAELTSNFLDRTQSLLFKISDSFTDNQIDKLIEYINVLFQKIPYEIIEHTESYFHSLFYLLIKLVGFQIEAEVLTIEGRIDAVVKTETHLYVIEFKINQSAQKAIQQIQDKKYATKYQDDNRKIVLLGINFDTDKKFIDDYLTIFKP